MINQLIQLIKRLFHIKKEDTSEEKSIKRNFTIKFPNTQERYFQKKQEALKKITTLKQRVLSSYEKDLNEEKPSEQKTNSLHTTIAEKENIESESLAVSENSALKDSTINTEEKILVSNSENDIKTEVKSPITSPDSNTVLNEQSHSPKQLNYYNSASKNNKRRISRQEKYLNEYIREQEKKKEDFFQPKKNVFKGEIDKNYVSKSSLMRKIKTNLFYLEELLVILENEMKYKKYYDKIKEMKEQSENNFKIVFRLRDDAPYLKKTLMVILEHTRTIAKLLESKIN